MPNCSSREHAEAIAFYRAGDTERELVATRLQELLNSRTLLIWWQRNLEAFQLSYQYVLVDLRFLNGISVRLGTQFLFTERIVS